MRLDGVHDQLFDDIARVIKTKQNSISLFYGLPGNGKRTALRYVTEKLKQEKVKICLVSIDVEIYDKEHPFLSAFYHALDIFNTKRTEVSSEGAVGETFLFKDLDKMLKVS